MNVICVEATGVNFLVYPSDRPGDVEIYPDVVKALATAFRKQATRGVDAPPVVHIRLEADF
ncbi:MAG: hypothetical protein RBG13Loki_2350 [Promethearchaeota archaeon CR_4]|nr:MAG: hypothetical protein RBG13Loki_2350 [Candidatus Lokiarchaeota archaeon CR_4]